MQEDIPAWGKVVAIIMICFGGFSACFQGYKILTPFIYKAQEAVDLEMKAAENEIAGDVLFEKVDSLFQLTNYQMNLYIIIGIVGLLLALAYVFAGIRLFRPKWSSFLFAKNAIILFIGFNLISCLLIITSGFSFITFELLFYSFVGIIIDVAVLLVMLLSDNKRYQPKHQATEK
jgi:hypothetical protein